MKNLTCTIFVCLLLTLFANAQTNSGSTETVSPAASKTKKKRAVFRATKEQITEVQRLLKKSGKFDGEADGKFNDAFRGSIKEFQSENGLRRTGTLNRATLEKMKIELTDKQKQYPVNSNSYASSNATGKKRKPRAKAFRPTKGQITEAQSALKKAGKYSGEVSGKYNKNFRRSVKDYQSANGLKRKGSLNRATLEKMGITLTESQKTIPVNPKDLASKKKTPGRKRGPVFRATKDQIRKVQLMLKDKGMYEGEQTGKLNPETRAAIRKWQTQNNVKKTGTLNKVTLEAMKIELTEKQKKF